MLIPTIIIGVLAVAALFFSYQKGVHIASLKASWVLIIEVLPIILFALILAATIQKIVPTEIVSKWVGTESGVRGILIGAAIGCFTPGGPYVTLPIAAALLRAGANIGTMVSFMTAWSLIGFTRLPLEVGIMGWKFAVTRLACTFFFAPIAGLLANTFFSRTRLL